MKLGAALSSFVRRSSESKSDGHSMAAAQAPVAAQEAAPGASATRIVLYWFCGLVISMPCNECIVPLGCVPRRPKNRTSRRSRRYQVPVRLPPRWASTRRGGTTRFRSKRARRWSCWTPTPCGGLCGFLGDSACACGYVLVVEPVCSEADASLPSRWLLSNLQRSRGQGPIELFRVIQKAR